MSLAKLASSLSATDPELACDRAREAAAGFEEIVRRFGPLPQALADVEAARRLVDAVCG